MKIESINVTIEEARKCIAALGKDISIGFEIGVETENGSVAFILFNAGGEDIDYRMECTFSAWDWRD